MTSEIERMAMHYNTKYLKVAPDGVKYLEEQKYLYDNYYPFVLFHAYLAGAKAVLEFARSKSVHSIVPIVTLEDLEKFIEGEKK